MAVGDFILCGWIAGGHVAGKGDTSQNSEILQELKMTDGQG